MVGKAIYDILSNDTDVAAVVNDRIYPNIVGQTKTLPFISYQKISTLPANTKTGESLSEMYRVQVSSFAKEHDAAVELAKKVRNALDQVTGNYYPTGYAIKVTDSFFDGEIDLYDSAAVAFEVAQDYMITAKIYDEGIGAWAIETDFVVS